MLSTVIWGSIPIFSVWSALPSPVFVFFRVFVSTIVLYSLMKKDIRGDLSALFNAYVVLSGILLAANWVFLFYAVNIIPISEAIIFYYSGPVITVLLSPLVKEKITKSGALGIFISFSGIIIMSTGNLDINILGVLFAILSGITYGLLSIVSKHSTQFVKPLNLVFIQVFLSTIILFPFLFLVKFSFTWIDLFIAVFSGLIQTVAALFLWYDSMKKLSIQLVSILSYLDPVFAIIFALVLLEQVPDIYTIIGGTLLIISGAFTTSLSLKS
ncbi:DMT family transporter [Cuniculiplasma sp. SKW3]